MWRHQASSTLWLAALNDTKDVHTPTKLLRPREWREMTCRDPRALLLGRLRASHDVTHRAQVYSDNGKREVQTLRSAYLDITQKLSQMKQVPSRRCTTCCASCTLHVSFVKVPA